MKPNETPSSIRSLVLKDIWDLDLDIDILEISRAHRHGSPYIDSDGIKQQATIVRFVSWIARDIYYRARKQSTYYLKASLTERRLGIMKYAREKVANDERVKSVLSFVCVDRNCRMVAEAGGTMWGFSSVFEFEMLVNYLEDREGVSKTLFLGFDKFGVSYMEPARCPIELNI